MSTRGSGRRDPKWAPALEQTGSNRYPLSRRRPGKRRYGRTLNPSVSVGQPQRARMHRKDWSAGWRELSIFPGRARRIDDVRRSPRLASATAAFKPVGNRATIHHQDGDKTRSRSTPKKTFGLQRLSRLSPGSGSATRCTTMRGPVVTRKVTPYFSIRHAHGYLGGPRAWCMCEMTDPPT